MPENEEYYRFEHLYDETRPLARAQDLAHAEHEGAEHYHFEYLYFDPGDAETGFSNRVEVISDSAIAEWTVHRLINDPKVWALHIRRYPQPEQDAHLYDETQHLAVAQNTAYAERKRADALKRRLDDDFEVGHRLEIERHRVERHNETTIEALNAVIETLVGQLAMIQGRAQWGLRDGVLMEPGDVFRDAKVNIGALRESEIRKATVRADRRALQDLAHSVDSDIVIDVGKSTDARLCVKCGQDDAAHIMWAQRHLPVFPEDLGPRVVEASEGLRQEEPESVKDTPVAEQSPDDICVCTHPRKSHQGDEGCGGAQCVQCAGDEHIWKHSFELAVL